ncbi:nuclear pore complex protein Nup50 [Varanus komodoensis]|uniref:Nuclear pore complex protein Nup50 n=1 Tax=Varanus komodoensis TaxID=61221 RepID=A0A8D2LTH9_VARKO|nr:nuclear pore complex protein Nup50 [Varanus komodoensis]XP_044306760.1 nuclear pore complex protein Nup50 [Varanus komodoensis]XP_044306761.1 nuclear pore complex protein Nup50 [Varanus komodoensis]XP_044306762.1 nuclear pore complex protein Nup50 [Varanus komodoensis]
MSKRVAEKELTDRNWDQEEETEEVGTFSVASEEVLKNRAIKKAKRRNVGFESESGGAFKGFKGFILPSGTGGFSGFGNDTGTKPLGGLSNGSSSVTNNSSFTTLKTAAETQSTFSSVVSSGSVNNIVVEKKPTNVEANGESRQLLSSGFTQSKACSSDIYHKQLAALNCSVRDWIVKHVNANPLCDLTPIFQDYEKYLVEIEQHGTSSDSGDSESDNIKAVGSQAGSASGSSNLQQGSTFFFNTNKSEDTSGKKMELEKKMEPKLGSTSSVSFTFSQSVDSSGVSSGALPSFSFSSGSTGLFGKDANQGKVVPSFSSNSLDTQTESGVNEEKGGEDEEEEPPKAVVNEIKEEDAFYSKKCKVFYKKDNEFKEKGVGTLHLKPAGNQKTQLLIRADTNLGNILLNILVPPKMPCSRTGKNNVLIVCVPNPPIDEKNATTPVPMLIRVKTSEDADELHNILLEKKDV